MGPGDRFKFRRNRNSRYLGIYYSSTPYTHTLGIGLWWWTVEIGCGLPYTDPDYVEWT